MNGISCRKCAEFSPEEMRPYKRESSNTRKVGPKSWSAELDGISDYKDKHLHLFYLSSCLRCAAHCICSI